MDILIIGNGFDLAHDLKTSYKDFLEFCSKNSLEDYTDGLSNIKRIRETNLWFKHFVTRHKDLGNNWIDLETEIFDAIKKICEDQPRGEFGNTDSKFHRVFYSIPKGNSDFSFNKLKDFYRRIDEVSSTIDFASAEDTFDEELLVKKGYMYAPLFAHPNFFNVLIKNPQALSFFLYDQLREFTMAFEKYLINIVMPTLKNTNYRLVLKDGEQDRREGDLFLLSFNYTDTLERLYCTNEGKRGFHIRNSMYIHGKIDNKSGCNLVLGTKSFNTKKDDKNTFNNIDKEFNIFQKHNQRHRYNTIESYQDFLRNILKKVAAIPTFHIIGHSLDEADHNILKHILLANDKAVINIYYYNEKAHQRLIDNITNIIGEEEVMARVRFIHQHDDKRGLLKIKKPSLTCSS